MVSNTSPLVYLAALGDFVLLQDLFSRIVIPGAVFDEITVGGAGLPVARAVLEASTAWLSVVEVANASQVDLLRQAGLDAGESEAIVLASEAHADVVLMDDSDGVRAATAAGLNVIRTAGIYRLAKQRQSIAAVRPKLDALRKAGFWLREDHYRAIVDSLGE